MAAAATSHTTRSALAEAIAADTTGNISLDDLIDRLGELDRALKVRGDGSEVATAAALLVDRNASPDRQFLMSLESALGARARGVDFASSGTAAGLNQWIAKSTRGLIPEIVPGLGPDTVLVLATAVFFKARWREAFDRRATTSQAFRTAAGGATHLPMMVSSVEHHSYRRLGPIHAVRLPYRGEAFENVVAMPVERGDTAIARWIAAAGADEWTSILDAADYDQRAVALRMPRQEITASVDLRAAVADLPALAPLMNRPAHFGRLADGPLTIDKVLHKALVRMDEDGTVAAAATVATVTLLAARPVPVDFAVDRPHVFLIRHVPTGLVVFAGYVADPKPLAASIG